MKVTGRCGIIGGMKVDIVSIALARFVKHGTDTGQLQEFVILKVQVWTGSE